MKKNVSRYLVVAATGFDELPMGEFGNKKDAVSYGEKLTSKEITKTLKRLKLTHMRAENTGYIFCYRMTNGKPQSRTTIADWM